MKIEIEIEDFKMLWHTACNIGQMSADDLSAFDFIKGDDLESFNFLEDHYMYWLGDSYINALAGLQIVKQNGFDAALLWDEKTINEENLDAWGFCILTNKVF